MKKKQLVAGLLATVMSFNVMTMSAIAEVTARITNTQTSSVEETVYVNSYSSTARKIDFSDHWRFYLGDGGSAATDYNDSSWKSVDLPHDYSIEQDYSSSNEAESGYLPGGTGWYRKSFTVSPDWADKTIQIDFGGVYMNATVYLNGQELGFHPYGYTAFSFELPKDILNMNGENVIAVKVEHNLPSSRWYSGSGIYRNVNLTVTDPVHVSNYGTYITTPDIKSGNGTVKIKTNIQNDTSENATVTVKQTVFDASNDSEVISGTSEEFTVNGNSTSENTITVNVPSLKLWSPDSPNMYYVRTEVIKDGQTIDTYDADFGFRYTEFNQEKGFVLNGVPTKLKGVCMHHDQGALGSEAWYRAMERQVEILKEMGCNAIRVTHNPPAKEFIDICNEKGMLVVDEAFDMWVMSKNGNSNDYSKWFEKTIGENNSIIGGEADMTWAEFDIKAMANQDKNAPSVIMYSLGNEIFEGTANNRAGEYPEIARKLCTWLQEVDPTRPPTFGQNTNNEATAYRVADVLDDFNGISGVNYADTGRYDTWVNKGHLVYFSETASAVNSRGIYDRKASNGDDGKGDYLITSYDKSRVNWGATASDAWMRTLKRDNSMGEFVWTGFDYIGEPTPWNGTGKGPANGTTWPNSPKSSYFGIIDTNGIPKDSYWLYQSMWNEDVKTLHILPTWNEDEIVVDNSGNVEVVVYSDAAKVELYLNDGEKPIATATSVEKTTPAGYKYRLWQGGENHTNLYATFQVPYAEGTLRAVAYDEQGHVISNTEGRSSVTTTGPATKLAMTADDNSIKADGDDLCYITIDVTDSKGNVVNSADNTINLSIEGDGKIVGVDNGRQPDHTSYQSLTYKAGAGKLVAIVQSTKDDGSFTVTAKSNGLASGKITVDTTPVEGENVPDESIVSYDISRYHYVKTGNEPQLPNEIKVTYKNGDTATKTVKWNDYNKELINQDGSFSISGTIEGTDVIVSVNVTMISEVVGLLNYSAAVQKNARSANLPASRPAILPNGTILNAEFPVEWNEDANLDEIGTHTIEGTSSVFGEEIPVKATIRVANGNIDAGANVAISANQLNQNIPEGQQSGNIEAVRDNIKEYSEGKVWENDKFTSGETSSITFTYATVQDLKQVAVYYTKDTNTDIPAEATLEWTPTGGDNWSELIVEKSEPEKVSESNGVQVYKVTYDFDPVAALEIRVNFKNAESKYTGITEIQLNLAERSFPVYSEDTLSKITVNGIDVDEYSLAKREYVTEALVVEDITAETETNTAFTILPATENELKILTESEDHSTRGEYKIILGGEAAGQNPADGSRDYDYKKTTATAPSYTGKSGNEGGPELAVDNNTNTFWHTRWGSSGAGETDLTNKADKRYIQLDLQEEITADALRYLPRPGADGNGGSNGIVKDYRVEVKAEGSEEWIKVSEGTGWERNSEWKIANFEEPTKVKSVRLYGVSTYGDVANKFMSAAEIRICVAKEKTDISSANITLEPAAYDYTGYEIKPRPTVMLGEEKLTYGVDYVIEYENNINPGKATLTVKGIVGYSGSVSTEFTINPVELTVEGYDKVEVTTYAGEKPQLPAKVKAQVNIGPDIEYDVVWDEIEPSKYSQPGTFTVSGTVEGQELKPTANVIVIGPTIAESFTTAVLKGGTPNLPEKLNIYFTDGSVEEFPVNWESVDTSTATVGDIIEVNGTIDISSSEAISLARTELVSSNLSVVAKVRIAEETETDNIALNTSGSGMPLAFAAHGETNWDYPRNINNGEKTPSFSNGKEVWTDWERNTYHTDGTWAGIILNENEDVLVNKVYVSFIQEDATGDHIVSLPKDFKVQYYTGNVYDYNNNSLAAARNWAELGNSSNWSDVTKSSGFENIVLKPADASIILSSNEINSDETHIATVLPVFPVDIIDKEEPTTDEDNSVEDTEIKDETNSSENTEVKDEVDSSNSEEVAEDANKNEADKETTIPAEVIVPAEIVSNAEEIAANSGGQREEHTVNFDTVSTGAIRVFITPKDGQWVGIEEIEVYGVYAEKYNDATVTGITINDKDVLESFDENKTMTYELAEDEELPNIKATVSEDKNIALTVVQSVSHTGEAYIIATSEDGTVTNKYTIKFSDNTPEEVKHTVTFETNNGTSIDPVTVVDGQKLDAPQPPTRDGYDFTGWYVDSECKVKYNFEEPVTKDMTIYAGWEKTSSGNTSTPTRYNINAEAGKGGTISPEGNVYVSKGADKTFRIKADTGYEIEKVLVDGRNEGAIDTYTFESVNRSHTIEARFKEVVKDVEEPDVPKTEEPDTTEKPEETMKFNDVKPGDWYYDAVVNAYKLGIMSGTSSTEFSPNLKVTRGMIVSILYRLSGEETVTSNTKFNDVSSDKYYAKAVSWATSKNIVSGYSENIFGAEDNVTREQLATILYRYAGTPKVDGKDISFADKEKVSDWAEDAIVWAVEKGILSGRTDGTLDPKGYATRAEIASMFMRMNTKK